MGDDGRYRCLGCDELLERDQLVCDRCGHEHVDAEELWAVALLAPVVFLLFAVLVLWAVEVFAPGTFAAIGPRGVVAVVAALWVVAFLQFTWDHLRYRRALGFRSDRTPFPTGLAVDDALERLQLTLQVGAGTALLGYVGGLLGPGSGYALALRLATVAGFGVMGYGGVVGYRLRDVLRPRHQLERALDGIEAAIRRTVTAVTAGAWRTVAGARPYVSEVVRGSRSVADDLRAATDEVRDTAERIDAARHSLSVERGLPVGSAGAREASREFSASWDEATASMERHWPGWGVLGIVESWTVLFATGVGVTYLTETMVLTWLLYTYFLFEDVALTRERYDWDPWWWAYSVAGLVPIVNIGVGSVYLLRRDLVRRGAASAENGDGEGGGDAR